jgi:hypothetical protein
MVGLGGMNFLLSYILVDDCLGVLVMGNAFLFFVGSRNCRGLASRGLRVDEMSSGIVFLVARY